MTFGSTYTVVGPTKKHSMQSIFMRNSLFFFFFCIKRHLAFLGIIAHLVIYIPVIIGNEKARGWEFLSSHHDFESETVIIKKRKKKRKI